MKVEEFVSLAEKRNRSIPRLIEHNEVYLPRNPKRTELLRRIGGLLVSRVTVFGRENLDKARDLSQDNQLIIASNHQSDADHLVRRMILEKSGFGDLADRLVFPAGLKMRERWYIRIFMGGEHTTYIPTPFDLRDIKDVMQGPLWGSFSQTEQELVARYWENCKRLGDVANQKLKELTFKGMVTLLYPEATRSRHNGLIQRAQKETAVYFPRTREDVYVLPLLVDGVHKILPVGTPLQEILGIRRGSVTAIVGEPFPAQEIWSRNLGHQMFEDEEATRADRVMVKIAALKPDLIDPKCRSLYDSLMS